MNDINGKPPAEAPAAQEEFDSAFRELAGGKPAEPEGEPQTPPAAAPEDPPPAAPAAGDEPPAGQPEGGTPVAQTPPEEGMDQVLARLDEKDRERIAKQLQEAEDLRKQNESLRHRALSDSGRISAFQRQLERMQRGGVAKAVQPVQNRDNPSNEGNRAALAKLQKLREDYPEIAGALEESMTAIREEIQGTVRGAVAPIEEDAAQRAFQEEMKILRDAHPDFESVINGSNFQNWIAGTPPSVRALMASPHAADAKWLLDQYSEHTRKAQAAAQPPSAPPPASPPPSPPDRLARATERPRRTAPAVPGAAEDFEGAWKQAVKARSNP